MNQCVKNVAGVSELTRRQPRSRDRGDKQGHPTPEAYIVLNHRGA
jgi:hypothetical protein